MYLILEHLTKIFPVRTRGGSDRCERISLGIAQGEFVTVLGPSGCGKMTALRLIAGFESPTQGRIMLAGQCLNDVPPNRRAMAMVFEFFYPTTKTDASKRLWQAFSLKGHTTSLVSLSNCVTLQAPGVFGVS